MYVYTHVTVCVRCACVIMFMLGRGAKITIIFMESFVVVRRAERCIKGVEWLRLVAGV